MTGRAQLRIIVIVLGVGACHSWSQAGTPQGVISHAGGGTIQVTKKDSSVVLVQSPTLVRDTLVGTSTDSMHVRLAIPMADVSSVAAQKLSLSRTAGAAYLTVLGGLFVALLVISVALLAVK
jgi:hypothetical protein